MCIIQLADKDLDQSKNIEYLYIYIYKYRIKYRMVQELVCQLYI